MTAYGVPATNASEAQASAAYIAGTFHPAHPYRSTCAAAIETTTRPPLYFEDAASPAAIPAATYCQVRPSWNIRAAKYTHAIAKNTTKASGVISRPNTTNGGAIATRVAARAAILVSCNSRLPSTNVNPTVPTLNTTDSNLPRTIVLGSGAFTAPITSSTSGAMSERA